MRRLENTEQYLKEQGVEFEFILSHYPPLLANRLYQIPAEPDPLKRPGLMVHYGMDLILHLTFFALADYIRRTRGEISPGDPELNRLVIGSIRRISHGTALGLFRELLRWHGQHPHPSGFLAPFEGQGDDLYSALTTLLQYRNRMQHKSLEITERNVHADGMNIVDAFISALQHSAALGNFDLRAAVHRSTSNRYRQLVFGGQRLPPYSVVTEPLDDKLPLQEPLLVHRKTGRWIPVYPFWSWQRPDGYTGESLFFGLLDSKKLSLTDNYHLTGLDTKAGVAQYEEVLRPLLPDYQYQSNPYYTGHRLLVTRETIDLDVSTLDGDVRTCQTRVVKCIRADELSGQEGTGSNETASAPGDSSPDSLHWDYHDAPIYPIPDSLFDLRVADSDGNELPVLFSAAVFPTGGAFRTPRTSSPASERRRRS